MFSVAFTIVTFFAQDPYALAKARNYADAIPAFESALQATPDNVSLRKDYAYLLLKTGDTEAARDQFALLEKTNPTDIPAVLEYAFLCHETGQVAKARQLFERLRTVSPEAEQAFQRIDKPLAEGIARWRRSVEQTPNNFSSHQELAQLAEQRGELDLAAQHYMYAWRLRNDLRAFLLDLGRVYTAQGDLDRATPVLLAASRGAEPRIADSARALLVNLRTTECLATQALNASCSLLPARYPFVSEFEAALAIDAGNINLRRELAFLLLAMNQDEAAIQHLKIVHEKNPKDRLAAAQLGFLYLAKQDPQAMALLESVLDGQDDELSDRVRTTLHKPQTLRRREETPTAKVNAEARELAEKSLEKGYLKDAVRYLKVVYETDPMDFDVLLKLGWTNNMLKQDAEAVKWFRLAKESPDARIANEAEQAYRNLTPSVEKFKTSVWIYPLYSSRWDDAFGYAQAKFEMKIPGLPVHPYVSTRFIGDVRRTTEESGNIPPQYLSENSFIFAIGLATPVYQHTMAWFEAGESLRYLGRGGGTGLLTPDYRGGLSFSRGWGKMLTSESKGFFAETNNDGIYVSRFNKDMLAYSQNRTGYTFVPQPMNVQTFWSWNATVDQKGFSWANYFEIGPGIRFRSNSMPQSMFFTVQALRGVYLIKDPARKPQYNDFRVGIWYAFAH